MCCVLWKAAGDRGHQPRRTTTIRLRTSGAEWIRPSRAWSIVRHSPKWYGPGASRWRTALLFKDNSLSIGRTPLIRLNRVLDGAALTMLAKIEGRNPAYS